MRKSFVTSFISLVCMCAISGCSTSDLQETAKQISDLEESMHNNQMYSLNMNKENGEEEVAEPEPDYVSYLQSLRGYDFNDSRYAVKVDEESGEAVYSLVPVEEAKKDGEEVICKNKLFGDIEKDYLSTISSLYQGKDLQSGNRPLNTSELKEAIMLEANLLLCVEYFQDDPNFEKIKEEAGRIAYLIYESVDTTNKDVVLKYNSVAILEKSIYVLPELNCSKEADTIAQTLWSEAEKVDDDTGRADINRAWAASEMYRVSGQKTYRTIVESVKENNDFYGFGYDNPGYYCAFAYLSSFEKTDYSVCEAIMSDFVGDANNLIKTDFAQFFEESLGGENLSGREYKSEYINDIIEKCTVAVMANKISASVEYTGYAENRVLFLCGANKTGVDYLSDSNQMKYCPALFVVAGLD